MIRRLTLLTPLLSALLAASVVSCGGGEASYLTTFASLDERDRLEAATDRVTVGGVEYALDPFLWRDFMPPGPEEGSDMMAVMTVRTTDGSDIPAGLDLVRLYVVNGADVWVTSFAPEDRPPVPPSELECIARGGPRWGPNISVDVYVKLADAAGDTAYLAARGQPIEATY